MDAHDYICKDCRNLYVRERSYLKGIAAPMSENRGCPSFLGVHVAERVLRHVFNDVEVMPYGNPGYDFKCNKGKLVDSKSSCIHVVKGHSDSWMFTIYRNKIAEYFLLLALDNRECINPLYAWLIPGKVLNHLTGTGISLSTIHKWDKYILDIDSVVECCNEMKDNNHLLV